MKTLGTLVVALALVLFAQTAEAHIVQFVTAVPMTAVDGGQDEAAVSNIILTAVKDALRQAVAFVPTVVVVEDARVVGGHLYLRVLAADREGEALIQELENARAAEEPVTSRDASPWGILVGADAAAAQHRGIRTGSSSTSPARSIRTRNGDPGVR
jgi:hypothetical protein